MGSTCVTVLGPAPMRMAFVADEKERTAPTGSSNADARITRFITGSSTEGRIMLAAFNNRGEEIFAEIVLVLRYCETMRYYYLKMIYSVSPARISVGVNETVVIQGRALDSIR